jgi:large repetitive protein
LVVPIEVDLYMTGNPVPVRTFNATTNTNGQFTITGVPVGTYNVKVKSTQTLARVKLAQALIAGGNTINFGMLLEGDANNDNYVDLLDFGTLLLSYNKILGNPGYDPRADFNGDNEVDLLDFGLLLLNYNQPGEENP